MIHSAIIKNPKTTPCPWWPKVDDLKRRKTFRFKPGLNILWGRNGTGKSTIISSLARYFHCEQGGRSVVTDASYRVMYEHFGESRGWRTGMKVEHDGQSVFYVNPSNAVGLSGGSFDDDFFMEGITNTMTHISSGQTTLMRTNMVMKHLKESKGEIEWNLRARDEIETKLKELLKGTHDKGKITLLLDEPDRSMDLDIARQLWDILPIAATERQIIVATHHPFALRLDANYIELGDKNYRDKCKALFPVTESP